MPYSDDELRKRIEELEKIIVALVSGKHFSVVLNEHGRPVLLCTYAMPDMREFAKSQ